jgi:hypothetical protein
MVFYAVSNMEVSATEYKQIMTQFSELVNNTVGQQVMLVNNLAVNLAVLTSTVFSKKVRRYEFQRQDVYCVC